MPPQPSVSLTEPEAVGSLAIVNVTTSSMFVHWDKPNGSSSFYSVRVDNGNPITPVNDTFINITGRTAGVQYEISVTAVADDGQTEGATSTVSNYTSK